MADVFFQATHPRARKAHKCTMCTREIGVGEVYRRQGGIFDGRAYTNLCCVQCEEFAVALFKAGFEGDEGGWPWISELEESEVAHVGYSKEMQLFRERWQRGGELVSFPALPISEEADRG